MPHHDDEFDRELGALTRYALRTAYGSLEPGAPRSRKHNRTRAGHVQVTPWLRNVAILGSFVAIIGLSFGVTADSKRMVDPVNQKLGDSGSVSVAIGRIPIDPWAKTSVHVTDIEDRETPLTSSAASPGRGSSQLTKVDRIRAALANRDDIFHLIGFQNYYTITRNFPE